MASVASSAQTSVLVKSPLFVRNPAHAAEERLQETYRRARAVAKLYKLSAQDVIQNSDKFWQMHIDNIVVVDGAMLTLLTIQYNLVAGTLAPYAEKRHELRPLLNKILNFDISAQFMLTEVAHGLDAPNIETTATLLSSGEFDLHTPRFQASKFMPPTGPLTGMGRVAIVFAKLIVDNEDRGIRPFIVTLSDELQMCKGVTSRRLPFRPGANLLDHSITIFTHVRLPHSALLGSLKKPENERANFISCTSRIGVGTLAISLPSVPVLNIVAYIAARYSARRTVGTPGGASMPILDFRTQQLPILHALAQGAVLKTLMQEAISIFRDEKVDARIRGGVAASVKAASMQHVQSSLHSIMERCGAQGLFEENKIVQLHLESKGIAIAEGDVLALSIRLATELLLGRYELPESRHPDCLLARHEAGLFSIIRSSLSQIQAHRAEAFNRVLLPLCRPLIEAIGHRMAYEAALDSNSVDKPLLDLYEAGVVKLNAAWYAEHAGLGFWMQHEMEERAASAALPGLERYLEETRMEAYVQTPLTSEENWDVYANGLECFEGTAAQEPLDSGKIPPFSFETLFAVANFSARL